MATQNSYNLNIKDFRAKKKAELEAARKKAKEDREALKKKREEDKAALKEQTETVKNNSDQPKGLAKFTPIILEKGSHIAMGMTPVLLTLAKDLFPNENDIDLCPSKAVCEKSLLQLNGIIDDLNKTSEFLFKITEVAGVTATGLATIQTVSSALKYSIPVVSTAAKFTPLIPGRVVSALDDLDWINNNLLYKNDGTPRLPVIIAGVAGITAATARCRPGRARPRTAAGGIRAGKASPAHSSSDSAGGWPATPYPCPQSHPGLSKESPYP